MRVRRRFIAGILVLGVVLAGAPVGTTAAAQGGPKSVVPQAKPAKVRWASRSVVLRGQAGNVTPFVLRFKKSGQLNSLGVKMSKSLRAVVKLKPKRVKPSGSSFTLPGTVSVTVSKPKSTYRGQIWLMDGKRRLGAALKVKVKVAKPSSKVVPKQASEAAPVRVAALSSTQKAVKDELLVVLSKAGGDPNARIKKIAKAVGAVIQGAVPTLRSYQLRFVGSGFTVLKRKMSQLERTSGVEVVSHNLVANGGSAIPNDPGWEAWDVANPAGNNWGLEYIDAPRAWDMTTGSKAVKVAVIDGAVDSDHGDLRGNIDTIEKYPWVGYGSGHGTHVAGTICAEGNNGVGITGVMWKCGLQSFTFSGDTDDYQLASAQQAMHRAVSSGARIVNMSLQFVDNNAVVPITPTLVAKVAKVNGVLSVPVQRALDSGRDVLWILAAGNERRDARYASRRQSGGHFSEQHYGSGSDRPDGSVVELLELWGSDLGCCPRYWDL